MGLRQSHQMVIGRTPRVDRTGLEQDADLVQGGGVVPIRLSVDRHRADAGRVEADRQSHRRRLTGAVWTQEACYEARLDLEGEIIDSGLFPRPLSQIVGLDHVAP